MWMSACEQHTCVCSAVLGMLINKCLVLAAIGMCSVDTYVAHCSS